MFGLFTFQTCFRKFYLNSPNGYSRKIINAQTVLLSKNVTAFVLLSVCNTNMKYFRVLLIKRTNNRFFPYKIMLNYMFKGRIYDLFINSFVNISITLVFYRQTKYHNNTTPTYLVKKKKYTRYVLIKVLTANKRLCSDIDGYLITGSGVFHWEAKSYIIFRNIYISVYAFFGIMFCERYTYFGVLEMINEFDEFDNYLHYRPLNVLVGAGMFLLHKTC